MILVKVCFYDKSYVKFRRLFLSTLNLESKIVILIEGERGSKCLKK